VNYVKKLLCKFHVALCQGLFLFVTEKLRLKYLDKAIRALLLPRPENGSLGRMQG